MGFTMSIQFGRWNFDDTPVPADYRGKVESFLHRYDHDRADSYCRGGISILYAALHTTHQSRLEVQPHISNSGAIVTWDGRLDNRKDLISQFDGIVVNESPDILIVAAAYDLWGTRSFARLLGDCALAIWDPKARHLILAKDPIGVRHLHYSITNRYAVWSTTLDPIVLYSEINLTANEEYLAGCLAFGPAVHLTPFSEIQSVPPASFVTIGPGWQKVERYWDFDPKHQIRHRHDRDYEAHFLAVFKESLRRRLRSVTPVLAELSGGMDSSSIVCAADTLVAGGSAETPCIDTLSYYDDSEPTWNERPYFTEVENKRARPGHHIDLKGTDIFNFESGHGVFVATPHSDRHTSKTATQFYQYLLAQRHRVVLSGLGGDEVLGGVPTPVPELADLFAGADMKQFAHQLKVWALDKRKPWFHLFLEVVRAFLPATCTHCGEESPLPPWFVSAFVGQHNNTFAGYRRRFRLFGPRPSFQQNLQVLDVLRRQIATLVPAVHPSYEYRYPYLDRDLLEFAFAVPRDQHVRPGHRRSLMRRALVGVVPDAVLNRRRKAYVSRAPLAAITGEWPTLMAMSQNMVSGVLGMIDQQRLGEALDQARCGRPISIIHVIRTLQVEAWLRALERSKLPISFAHPSGENLSHDCRFVC